MSISIAQYLICAIGVNAGGKGSYGKHFGSNELKCKELAGNSRRPHFMTFQRRDVGSTNIEVNKRQCRDVSAISASPSLKAKKGPEFEASRIVRRRA